MGDIPRDLVERVEAIFPDNVASVKVHAGDDFTVVEVNGSWMFRFPRNPAAADVLEIERSFLEEFARKSPIPVPYYEIVGQRVVGYRKLDGALLTNELLCSLDRGSRANVARQLGAFLSAVHSVPVERALAMGMTIGWGGWRRQAWERFRADVAPDLSIAAQRNAVRLFDKVFALEWEPVVIHGDFYPADHVLVDLERQQLCGVIDFGDLTIEDAATDFKSILEDYGVEFLQEVSVHYCGDIDDRFIDRVQTRLAADPLFGAAYALEYGFEDRFERHLMEIEESFG